MRNNELGRPPKMFQDELQIRWHLETETNVRNVKCCKTKKKKNNSVEKIQKSELNVRQIENWKTTCEILFQRHNRKSVLLVVETGFIFRILNTIDENK